MIYQIDSWAADPKACSLTSDTGDEVHLTPQTMDVLVYLAERTGEVVSSQEMLDDLWSGTITGDYAIHNAISRLRNAFGDSAKNPKYLATVPKRGYRLIADVQLSDSSSLNRNSSEVVADEKGSANKVGTGDSQIASSATLRADDSTTGQRQVSLAILPLRNLGDAENSVLLAEGITEDLTTLFSRVPEFWVISRSSVQNFNQDDTDLKTIGTALNVRYLVQGSLRLIGGQLRVSIQLCRAETGEVLWAEQYDRLLRDLFQVCDEIAQSTCAQLQPTLTLAEVSLQSTTSTRLDAWSSYQKGWATWSFNFNKEASEDALLLLEQSIQQEPDNAVVLASCSIVHANRMASGWAEDPLDELGRAAEHLQQALALSSDNPTVMYANAVYCNAIGERRNALAQVTRATEREPCNSSFQSLAGLLNSVCTESRKGIAQCEKSIALSPFDPRLHILYVYLAFSHYWLGEYEDGYAAARRSIDARDDNPWGWLSIMIGSLHMSDLITAKHASEKIHQYSSWTQETLVEVLFHLEDLDAPKVERAEKTKALFASIDF